MSDQLVKLSNPISVKDDSPYRVAYDLMKDIASSESIDFKQDRAYWFKLYAQCFALVYQGFRAEDVMNNKFHRHNQFS